MTAEQTRKAALAASQEAQARAKRENALRDAAPELLKALQGYVDAFEHHFITNTHGARDFDFTGHIAAQARAAIAKATGDTE